MIDIDTIQVGDKVHYKPDYFKPGTYENGMVKEIRSGVFVVYNCNDDWDNFKDYTGQRTRVSDLYLGWGE